LHFALTQRKTSLLMYQIASLPIKPLSTGIIDDQLGVGDYYVSLLWAIGASVIVSRVVLRKWLVSTERSLAQTPISSREGSCVIILTMYICLVPPGVLGPILALLTSVGLERPDSTEGVGFALLG